MNDNTTPVAPATDQPTIDPMTTPVAPIEPVVTPVTTEPEAPVTAETTVPVTETFFCIEGEKRTIPLYLKLLAR